MNMNYEVKLENKYLAFTFHFDNLGEALEFVRLALRYCSKEIKYFRASIHRTVEDGEEYVGTV